MASIIKISEIQTNAGAQVSDMIRELDMWRLATSEVPGSGTNEYTTSQNESNPIISQWERPTGTHHNVFPVPIGTGLTSDNGVFSFPMTGYYKIEAIFGLLTQQSSKRPKVVLKVSNDNGNSYTDYVEVRASQGGSSQYIESCSMKCFINVKNISGSNTTKFNFTASDMQVITVYNPDEVSSCILGYNRLPDQTPELTQGNDGVNLANLTYFTCQRLAPAQ